MSSETPKPKPNEPHEYVEDEGVMGMRCGICHMADGADVHIKWLQRELREARRKLLELKRFVCTQDCRYTMGDVADISGSHCPLDAPCQRCKLESAEARVREARKNAQAQHDTCELVVQQRDNWKARAESAEAALREARDKALEEAARVCDAIADEYYSRSLVADQCAKAIRSLKTPPVEG